MKSNKKIQNHSDFVRYCLELLAPVGNISSRAMFGGYALCKDRLIFGLIANDRLYFKVDDQTLPQYQAHNAESFTYTKQGKRYRMSYYEVPISVIENQDNLAQFALDACAATRRNAPG